MPRRPQVLGPPERNQRHGRRRLNVVRRSTALLLMVVGQAALALFAPPIAAVPAFASFVAAGFVLAK
jgi:hypothetical protein